MLFVYKNLLAMVLAATGATFAWLYGGTIGDIMLRVTPWLCVLIIEVMFFFPQRRASETTYEARERVWESVWRDPLTLVWLAS